MERFDLKFNGSWPLPMGALMSCGIQHLLMREKSYGSTLLRYFSGLWPVNNLDWGTFMLKLFFRVVRIHNSTYGKIFASCSTALTFSSTFSWAAVADGLWCSPATMGLVVVCGSWRKTTGQYSYGHGIWAMCAPGIAIHCVLVSDKMAYIWVNIGLLLDVRTANRFWAFQLQFAASEISEMLQ